MIAPPAAGLASLPSIGPAVAPGAVLDVCYDPSLDPSFGAETIGPIVFFVIGLLGGAHCLGMCGPLVTTYADRLRTDDRRELLTPYAVRQHTLFNLGRTASYAAIGALFGALGAFVFVAPMTVTAAMGEIHAVAGLLVGTIIIVIGVNYLRGGGTVGGSLELPLVGRGLRAVQRWLLARVDRWVGGVRITGLGAAHGALPCPLTYPAYLYALVQGSPAGGAVSLAALGLGTIPSLFLYGTLFQAVSVETRMRLHRVLGVAFVALGYISFQHGLAALGVVLPHPPIPYYQPL